jgi:hypothetical protein
VLESAADSREVALGQGAHSTSTFALEVEYTHPWGLNPTLVAMRKAVSRGAAQSAENNHVPRQFRLKRPYPAPLRSDHRSDLPIQPLPWSVLAIERSASDGVLGLSQTHTAHIAPLPGSVSHTGKVRAVFYGSTGAENTWKPAGIRQTRRKER